MGDPSKRGEKRTECEADYSPPSVCNVKVRNGGATTLPPNVFMAWYLIMYWDNFTFNIELQCQMLLTHIVWFLIIKGQLIQTEFLILCMYCEERIKAM
jgi:hypothetical protein